MANPDPSWEDYDTKEETDTDTETEEEEDDGESKDDNNQEKENTKPDKEEDNWLTAFIKRGFQVPPFEVTLPQREGLKQTDQNELDFNKEQFENHPGHFQGRNPFVEDEKEHFLEREVREDQDEIDTVTKENNSNELDKKVVEDDYFNNFPENTIFREKGKDGELNLTSDEEEITDNSDDEDDFEEGEEVNEEDIKFDYNDYPEEKPIPFGEDKPDTDIDPELLDLFDGKEGEPDPYSFRPLDLLDGVQIGDERWKAMMEQIMQESPYLDYVPPETKPPHEIVWEMWDRTDYNEGRWVDDYEFLDDPSLPTDFTGFSEELTKLTKRMQEGKPLP